MKSLLHERYEIKEVLGRGGFATTYLAIDTETQQQCAIKCLSFRKIEEWKTWELFEREARVLKNLDHPNIPHYLDFFTVETEQDIELYLVQEYAAGKSLTELVRAGRHFTEREVITLALKMCRILSYLHSFAPPIIHRDIKPGNITLTPDNRIHLIDFGAVKDTLTADYTKLSGATIIGTYGYMPVEQYEGRALPASDIYALGMTLIYLLSHKEPADMEKTGLQWNFRLYATVSERFAKVLGKMIDPNSAKRYQSADELKRDLEPLLAAGFVAQAPSRPIRLAAAAAVFLCILLGASYYFFFAPAPIVPPVITPTPVLPTPLPQVSPSALFPTVTPFPTRTPFATPAPSPTPLPTVAPRPSPTPLPPLSLRGQLLFDDQPITAFTTAQPSFWMRNEDTNREQAAPIIPGANGSFAIHGLPNGKFMFTVELNANTMNARLYPGDFRAGRMFDFVGPGGTELIVDLEKIIHLTSPQDNDAVMEGGQNCRDMRTLSNPLLFQWESLGAQVIYQYKIIRYDCRDYNPLETIVSETTQATTVTFPLKPNNPNEYYGFYLSASKNERPLGALMIHHVSNGTHGESNEYRFRVK